MGGVRAYEKLQIYYLWVVEMLALTIQWPNIRGHLSSMCVCVYLYIVQLFDKMLISHYNAHMPSTTTLSRHMPRVLYA